MGASKNPYDDDQSAARDFHTPGYRQRVEDEMDNSVNEQEAEQKALERMTHTKKEDEYILAELKKAEAEELHKQPKKKLFGAKFASGTILEAAFVDPAYSWPPVDGQGKNAIELQASIDLLQGDDEVSVGTTESMMERMKAPAKPTVDKKKAWWKCCSKQDKEAAAAWQDYEERKTAAKEARRAYSQLKREKKKNNERESRRTQRYNRVPEGVLIYRLDTSTHELTLMSPPHQKTNMSTLVESMVVVGATPGPDKTRRGMVLEGEDGQSFTLTACEQRTAISWLEAIQLMMAREKQGRGGFLSRRVRIG